MTRVPPLTLPLLEERFGAPESNRKYMWSREQTTHAIPFVPIWPLERKWGEVTEWAMSSLCGRHLTHHLELDLQGLVGLLVGEVLRIAFGKKQNMLNKLNNYFSCAKHTAPTWFCMGAGLYSNRKGRSPSLFPHEWLSFLLVLKILDWAYCHGCHPQ